MTKDPNKQKKQQAKSFLNKKDLLRAGNILLEVCRDSPDAESHLLLAQVYTHASNFILSEQQAKLALQFNPEYAQAWNQLGIVQEAQGNHTHAITSFNKSIEINPKYTQSFINLGNIHRELGNQSEAEASYKKALKLDKNNFITLNNIANIYLSQCQYDKAERHYIRAIKLNKNYFDAYYNLGATYQCKGDHKLAINYYKRAQKLSPENSQPQAAIANSYEKQGKYDRALEHLTPLIAKNIITPDIADTYSKICLKNKDYDKGISVISQCLATRLNPIHEQTLRFCLGDLLDKKGSFHDAFKEYATANTMRPYEYDKTKSKDFFNYIKHVFSVADNEQDYVSENLSNTPIFIIGMPRSGTSLIEQILSSHSKVCGAGELPYMGEIAEQLACKGNLTYPENIKQLTSKKLTELAGIYLTKLKQHGDGSNYISDKMPHNFLYVGLIRRLFPYCKIIHCLRSPLDICISIYFHNFNNNHPYSDSLDSLGHYYNQYRELMSFWHEQYPDLIIDVAYEDLISNTEVNIRRMLQHVGLEWQDNCLKYYENKRTVSTPSYAQVTQPLYTSSMERWLNYETHVDELKAAIDDSYL